MGIYLAETSKKAAPGGAACFGSNPVGTVYTWSRRRRRIPIRLNPVRPAPSSKRVAGSGTGVVVLGVDASTGPVAPAPPLPAVLKTSSAKNALGEPPALTVTSPVGGGVRNNPPAAVRSNAIALVVKSGLLAPLPQL